MEHSKLPWHVGRYGGIYPSGDNASAIASLTYKDGSLRSNHEADSDFIVTACNAHATFKAKEELLDEIKNRLLNADDSSDWASNRRLIVLEASEAIINMLKELK